MKTPLNLTSRTVFFDIFRRGAATLAVFCGSLLLTSSAKNTSTAPFQAAFRQESSLQFPYKKAGFTEAQAAAFLLDRFAFGARPGDVDAVVKKGLERWFAEQLEGNLPEPTQITSRLAELGVLSMKNEEIVKTFPNVGFVLRQAVQEGVVSANSLKGDAKDDKEYRATLLKYAAAKGYRPKRELQSAMYAQKLLRAVHSPNQLHEVLTDFWFNHFNVSITDNQADQFVMTYERDAIRPNVVGNFRTLLGATAKHPAMLAYLDNAQSTAPDGTPTTQSLAMEKLRNVPGVKGEVQRRMIDSEMARMGRLRDSVVEKLPAELQPRKGINENYARELMELHTLGVDGGYSQKDVTEAARILTGWTTFPMGPRADRFTQRMENNPERFKNFGFVREGDFLFRADVHDATAKTVMGTEFPAGGGKEEGEKLLDILAMHSSTATFICTKLAKRFVSDAPPESLVNSMKSTFSSSGGNIKEVLRTLAASDEFWLSGQETALAQKALAAQKVVTTSAMQQSSAANAGKNSVSAKNSGAKKGKKAKESGEKKSAEPSNSAMAKATPVPKLVPGLRTKIKSPFELVVSSLRAMGAEIVRPREVLEWIRKIGQPLYAYQAPTGFPDRADAWINTGALLGRMNFGLNLALGNIAGVKFDLASLNNNHEPQSAEDALETYARLLMPERNLSETLRLLKPVLADPEFAQKLSSEAQKNGDAAAPPSMRVNERKPQRDPDSMISLDDEMNDMKTNASAQNRLTSNALVPNALAPNALAQVVGIILGSPEFQRR